MPDNPITFAAGDRYGLWTIIGPTFKAKNGLHVWCRCACGLEKPVRGSNLSRGLSRGCMSCGRLTHGYARRGRPRPEYPIWLAMHNRCNRETGPNFKHYRGRGIVVCPRWASFPDFLEDMGPRPTPKHTLERINNEEGYSPENCCWVTMSEQLQNTRRTHFLTIGGRTMSVAAWARETGISRDTLGHRSGLGLSDEQLLQHAPLRAHYLTHDGRTQTLAEWAREYGLNPKTLQNRLERGIATQVALETPARFRSKRWH